MSIESSTAEIARFRTAATAGSVRFDADAARQCAQLYQDQADRLIQLKSRLEYAADAGGFGGFVSADQLRDGFANKARDAAELLDRYVEAAYRLKEAFLLSAGLYEEADAAGAAAMRTAVQV
ncbi:hypothetical protein [Nocardia camponoti]|uniref:Uncharacterized protein n=1 Tax=Nocardia camponoti TaxID=1616106 RepID=A0A917QR17_9NOCA|nr:hypothetical protein [Nocardia camponoti]GGK63902.1 hypothetical protein GCM10011591_40240 [Nocardia camponoti]